MAINKSEILRIKISELEKAITFAKPSNKPHLENFIAGLKGEDRKNKSHSALYYELGKSLMNQLSMGELQSNKYIEQRISLITDWDNPDELDLTIFAFEAGLVNEGLLSIELFESTFNVELSNLLYPSVREIIEMNTPQNKEVIIS
jgi:hypothetical protein